MIIPKETRYPALLMAISSPFILASCVTNSNPSSASSSESLRIAQQNQAAQIRQSQASLNAHRQQHTAFVNQAQSRARSF